MRIPFRKQLQLATMSADIVGDFNKIWKFGRKYPIWLSDLYDEIVVIATNRDITIPKPKINMRVE